MKLEYTFSIKDEIEFIHDKSLKILEEVGVIFHNNEKAINLFKQAGARVDGDKIYIPRKLVESAIEKSPSSYQWYGRNGTIEIGNKKPKNLPAYGPMYVLEAGEYHTANHDDVVNFHKLHETSSVMDVSSPNALDASFVDKKIRNNYKMGLALKYCKKPLMGMTDGLVASRECIEFTQKFYDVFDQIVVSGLINCSSPLLYADAMSEAIIEYAEKNQALCITGSCVSGLTGPPSLAGVVVQGNAEVLAGLTLAQLAKEGTPVVYCLNFSSSDLRHACCELGGSEGALLNFTARELADYYQLPLRSGGGLTDAKLIDYQAGYETFMIMMATYMAKVDFVTHSCGIMDTMNSISYEKYLLDEELIQIIQRYLRGYVVDEKTVMFERIKKVGPGGNFMGRTDQAYLNDYFLPNFSNRMTHGNWINSGKPSVESLVQETLKERLDSFQLPENSSFQTALLKEYVPGWN